MMLGTRTVLVPVKSQPAGLNGLRCAICGKKGFYSDGSEADPMPGWPWSRFMSPRVRPWPTGPPAPPLPKAASGHGLCAATRPVWRLSAGPTAPHRRALRLW